MEWALQGGWLPIQPGTGGFRDLGTYLLADGLLAAVCHLLEPFGKLNLWKEKVGSEKTRDTGISLVEPNLLLKNKSGT